MLDIREIIISKVLIIHNMPLKQEIVLRFIRAGDLNTVYVVLECISRRLSYSTVRTHNKVTLRAPVGHLNTSKFCDVSLPGNN